MTVTKVGEINATSDKSFDDAMRQGLVRANRTLKNSAGCRTRMRITFVLEG